MNRTTQRTTRSRSARPRTAISIGPWRLVRQLGEGQWTDVYQARPVSNNRDETADYVVKMLKPNCEHDPVAIRLLQREAFVAASVRHPHLSSILSAHTDKTPHYVVMPYIKGVGVSDALEATGRFATPQSLWIVRQVAEALYALHQQGWLHGDVKPANIVVSPNGHATLIDFGLARSLEASQEHEHAFTGSMAYACPEAFNSNVPFGPTSDVYSLGITLYELLTASRPYDDDNPTDLAAAHLTGAIPDPRLIVPQLPARISRLLRQMLAKDPLRRPAGEELIDWLVDLEVETFTERGSISSITSSTVGVESGT
jgi:serine/threonine protein kinase